MCTELGVYCVVCNDLTSNLYPSGDEPIRGPPASVAPAVSVPPGIRRIWHVHLTDIHVICHPAGTQPPDDRQDTQHRTRGAGVVETRED